MRKCAEKRDCRDLPSDCRLQFQCLFIVHNFKDFWVAFFLQSRCFFFLFLIPFRGSFCFVTRSSDRHKEKTTDEQKKKHERLFVMSLEVIVSIEY